MAVPDYQEIMLPLLRRIGDENVHSLSELTEELAQEFRLTPEDKKEFLPSGGQYKFDNRVGWARTYMKKAGLLISTDRGKIKITERGKQLLDENPMRIDTNYLKRYPEFVEFKGYSAKAGSVKNEPKDDEVTPEELLEEGFSDIQKNLINEVIERTKAASPKFFEQLVIDLLLKMGYGGTRKDAGERLGRSGDGGIDGIIKEDKLGLDVIYIQAKRWNNTVGSSQIRDFVGSLEEKKARRGIFITTSKFSADASKYVDNIEKKVVLIDGEFLAKLMIDHGVGVSTTANYELKKIDGDYFAEE